jgi:peptide/nickel transport system substrate-binding protein
VDLISHVAPHQTDTIANDPELSVLSVPSGRIIFIQWVADSDGITSDPRVRRAFQYGVNITEVVDTILEGYAVTINQPLTAMDFGHHPGLSFVEYNPEKGRELLQQAGYSDGLTIVLDSPVGRYTMDKEIAQAIAGQLEEMGVHVKLNLNEWGVHVNKILDRQMENGYLIGWGSSLFDADATLYPNFHSEQRISFFNDARVDHLLDRARETMDSDKRLELYHEVRKDHHR